MVTEFQMMSTMMTTMTEYLMTLTPIQKIMIMTELMMQKITTTMETV